MHAIAYAAEIEHEGDLDRFRSAIASIGGTQIEEYHICYGDEDAAFTFQVDAPSYYHVEAALEDAGVCIIQVGPAVNFIS